MARGETSEGRSDYGGWIGGAVLLTLALGAILIVVATTREPEAPAAPSDAEIARSSVSGLHWRLCEVPVGADPKTGVEADLRRRGYEAVGEWRSFDLGTEANVELEGACGVVAALASPGSQLDEVGSTGCGTWVRSIATCGSDVLFNGVGMGELRVFRLPGVFDVASTLSLEHRMAHAEATRLIGAGADRVLLRENTTPLTLATASCTRYVAVSTAGMLEGDALVSVGPPLGSDTLAGVVSCGDATLSGSANLSLRRLLPSGGARAEAAMPTIDAITVVDRYEEL
ncbi:MAG: hypothetical protein AAF938_27190 [Myxococcota bacterium]